MPPLLAGWTTGTTLIDRSCYQTWQELSSCCWICRRGERHVALWPAEYEGLRAEAREMASKLASQFGAFVGDSVPSDRMERLALQRRAVDAMVSSSPAGCDEILGGVP